MYEVLKFIEHGAHCRQSMVCIQGTVLLNYLKENSQIDKTTLIRWFRELAVCMDQYHRSHSRQNYRYLNPCSIVVSEEGTLFLLDMESAENEPVMKRMQKRAVRSHFVKPVYEIGTGKNNEADLFAYGKTIQFILAYTDVQPVLNRWEEGRLSRIIGRCTGEYGRKYDDLRQVLNDLPGVPKIRSHRSVQIGCLSRSVRAVMAGVALCLFLGILLGVGRKGIIYSRDTQLQALAADQDVQEQISETYHFCDAVIRTGRAANSLAGTLKEQELLRETIGVYDRLIILEDDKEKVKEAALKKMKLEMERGDYEQALKTAEAASEKIGGAEELAKIARKYDKK